ncbi:hypothetical protein EV672_1227 [Aquabacterium commune]|uniref:Uncharacterized protein n=1 Tax=Aquabacterium commune TaxID=70586 RepID=A0A4R6QZB6_9BURK|nr:hypothetical protein [Aquabacterium commune]TDP78640.1 hypothetical protein EV672_1227 [Aquabacterium commune]
MRLEREIQDWIVQLVDENGWSGGSNLYSVLRYDSSPLSQEMKAQVERFDVAALAPSRHRAVPEACRVLRSLVEPRLLSSDTNIAVIPGQTLKPDLVLEDVISGAYVIVELKRSKKAAREFATELLAYANCLIQQRPGSTVFLVLVSTSWAPLEQFAFAELARRNIPVLALEYREEPPGEGSPTLWVRSDLLPIASVNSFPSNALLVDTKVFWLPQSWQLGWSNSAPWMNRIEHAVGALVREAEQGHASGFVLIWYLPHEVPSQVGNRPEVRVFVSVAIRNPSHSKAYDEFNDEQESRDFTRPHDPYASIDDTAVRLLLNLELGRGVQSFSSESEGTWDDLRARLERENACILRFDGFGEIGYQVSRWRTQKRYSLHPLVPDITVLPAWHPLTWLAALESLIDLGEQEDGDSLAWHAFRLGEGLSKIANPYLAPHKGRHFGNTAAQARFARTWCDFFATHKGAPNLSTQIDNSGFRCPQIQQELAIRFASSRIAEEGELANLCFALGYQAGSGCDNIDYLVSQRHKLRNDGICLPQKLDARLDELDRHYKQRFRPSTTMWVPPRSER